MDSAMASYGSQLKSADTLGFPYDLHTVLSQNIDESQSKKSYDARINCKHIRRSPWSDSPTMSAEWLGKSCGDRGKCNLDITAEKIIYVMLNKSSF